MILTLFLVQLFYAFVALHTATVVANCYKMNVKENRNMRYLNLLKVGMKLALCLATQKERGDIHLAKSQILAIDAGGTMTDTFIIDEKGEFVVGKAQT